VPLAPPPEFQWKLVEAYSNERCDVVRDAVKPEMYEKLRPNVRAIVAFCEPKGIDPEKLFASAEKEDPGGDLVHPVKESLVRSLHNPPVRIRKSDGNFLSRKCPAVTHSPNGQPSYSPK
jgi:hypothetical protein